MQVPAIAITPFSHKLIAPLLKYDISVLQVNLGRICNLACTHCHVEASPHRTEELSPEICQQLIEIIQRFPQIQTVDLTGGAPEMLHGFRELVKVAREQDKEAIVRSNLTIYFEKGYEDIPEFFAQYQVRELWLLCPVILKIMWTRCVAKAFSTGQFRRCNGSIN